MNNSAETHARICRAAYERYSARGTHGHDLDDYYAAEKDPKTWFDDKYDLAEYELGKLSLRYWTYWEVVRWNKLVLNFLTNDYFPLLRNDDMPEYGDRVSPFHMVDLLFQRDRTAFRDRGLTEEEWDDRIEFKKQIKGLVDYCFADLCERRVHLAVNLYNPRRFPSHDVNYVWGGKPYEKEVYPPIKPHFAKPRDHLPYRMPKAGDELTVASLPTDGYYQNLYHPNGSRYLRVGDVIKVNRVKRISGRNVISYLVRYNYDYNFPVDHLSSPLFNIHIPADWDPYPVTKPAVVRPYEAYRPKHEGMNAYSDAILLDSDYTYTHRVTPRHLCDILGLRLLDLVSPQQASALLKMCWDDFGWNDVLTHCREMGIFDEVSFSLSVLVSEVLAHEVSAVSDYRGGKKAAFGRLMGSVMKAAGGKAKPAEVKELLETALAA